MSQPQPRHDPAALSSERRALVERLIRGAAPRPGSAGPAEPRPTRTAPASYAQRRLWFLDQVQQEQVPYTLYGVLRLDSAIDPGVLGRALNVIVRRHEILRTTFISQDGEPVQQIHNEPHISLDEQDVRSYPAEERPIEATRRIARVIARRMDLERGPLLRTSLYRLGEREWQFLLVVHHIVFDGRSFPVFFAELQAVYEEVAFGRPSQLAPPRVQYADFAKRQRSALTPARVAEEVAFWQTELADLGVLDLPLDRSRPPVQTFRGAQQAIALPADLVRQLQALAVSQKTTLFTVLLAGAAAALSRICTQDDFALGLPVTGRDTPELASAIGFFVDTIVVRCRVEADLSVEQLIDRTRSALNRALAHRLLPFEMLVEHLRPARDLGLNPLFQVGFQLTQVPREATQPNTLDVPRAGVMFDLGFDLWTEGDAVAGRIEFNTDLFDRSTIETISAMFSGAMRGMLDPVRRVSDLEPYSDRPQALSILRGAAVGTDDGSATQLIADLALAQPAAVAIDGIAGSLTYAGLLNRAGRLAHALRSRGVGRGSSVALLMARSPDLVPFWLACWFCEAAFIPLDPSWPESRVTQVLTDARPAITIDATLAGTLSHESAVGTVDPKHPAADSAAYAIFTSGSTGSPKGVVLEHGGLLNVALAQRQVFQLAPGRRVAQLASPTFDASVFEAMLALGSGGTLVVAPAGPLAGEELAAFLREGSIDAAVLPPSLLATVRPADVPELRLVLVAGESCSTPLAEQWSAGREFWNLYGPTEVTIWATYGRGAAAGRMPIGQPIANTTTLVLGSSGRPVTVGQAGELCVAGAGVARGYLNHPELTASRFGVHPLAPGLRMYRTGDRVRQLHDGHLVFLGRMDRQVKVRGFRIEPEEIEAVLREEPTVADVAVEAKSRGTEQLLVAYLVCNDAAPDVDRCRARLLERLPQYMVPTHFVSLREFPRMASGKIDRAKLPLPAGDDRDAVRWYVEPSTPTERQVAELMGRTASAARVSAGDDFFRIGGHSLAAAELVSRVRSIFKVELGIRDVFAYPTVTALAARIDSLRLEPSGLDEDEVPLVRLPRRHEMT